MQPIRRKKYVSSTRKHNYEQKQQTQTNELEDIQLDEVYEIR